MKTSNLLISNTSLNFDQMLQSKQPKRDRTNNKDFNDFMKQYNAAKQMNEINEHKKTLGIQPKYNNNDKKHVPLKKTNHKTNNKDKTDITSKEMNYKTNEPTKDIKPEENASVKKPPLDMVDYESILLQLVKSLKSVQDDKQAITNHTIDVSNLTPEGQFLGDKIVSDIQNILTHQEKIKSENILELTQLIGDTLDEIKNLEMVMPSKLQDAVKNLQKSIEESKQGLSNHSYNFEQKAEATGAIAYKSHSNLESENESLNTTKIEITSADISKGLYETPQATIDVHNNALQDINGRNILKDIGEIVAERENLFDQIVEKAKMELSGTKSSMRIHLKPEHLGKLAMELHVEKGHVIAKVVVSDSQVKQLLENNFNNLKEGLSQQGLNIDEINVTIEQGTEQHKDRLFDHHQNKRDTNKRHGNKSKAIDLNYLDNSQSADEKSMHHGQLNLMA